MDKKIKAEANFTCEKCGEKAVDTSLICGACGWDHFFGEFFGDQEDLETEEYQESEDYED